MTTPSTNTNSIGLENVKKTQTPTDQQEDELEVDPKTAMNKRAHRE